MCCQIANTVVISYGAYYSLATLFGVYRKQVFPIIGSYLYFVAIDIILILLCLTVGVKHRKV